MVAPHPVEGTTVLIECVCAWCGIVKEFDSICDSNSHRDNR